MHYTDEGLPQLIINKLTNKQYRQLIESGQISSKETYITTDDSSFYYSKEDVDNIIDDIIDNQKALPPQDDQFGKVLSTDGNQATWKSIDNTLTDEQKEALNSGITSETLSQIENAVENKVDKITGYSLVSDAEILRLSSVYNYDDSSIVASLNNKVDTEDFSGFQVATQEALNNKVNEDEFSTFKTITNEVLNNKADISSIPTKVSDLSNDRHYVTEKDTQDLLSVDDLLTTETIEVISNDENNELELNVKLEEKDNAITVTENGLFVDKKIIDNKADADTVYTKAEVDKLLEAIVAEIESKIVQRIWNELS